MHEKKNLAKFIQESIDKGATTVEEIHKSIADLPLKVLEQSDLLRGPVKEAKRVQDYTLGAIYDVIREVNRQVGTLASDLLAEAAERRAARVREADKSRHDGDSRERPRSGARPAAHGRKHETAHARH